MYSKIDFLRRNEEVAPGDDQTIVFVQNVFSAQPERAVAIAVFFSVDKTQKNLFGVADWPLTILLSVCKKAVVMIPGYSFRSKIGLLHKRFDLIVDFLFYFY